MTNDEIKAQAIADVAEHCGGYANAFMVTNAVRDDTPGQDLLKYAVAQREQNIRMERILKLMVGDDAFAELCAGIGEEPIWLKLAREVLDV